METIFISNDVLHTPQKNCIRRLGQRAEVLHARVGVLEKQKEASQAVLSTRRTIKSGQRVSIEGEHLLTTETVYKRVNEAEIKMAAKKKKTGRKGKKKEIKVNEDSTTDEDEVEILDEIVVEDYIE